MYILVELVWALTVDLLYFIAVWRARENRTNRFIETRCEKKGNEKRRNTNRRNDNNNILIYFICLPSDSTKSAKVNTIHTKAIQ